VSTKFRVGDIVCNKNTAILGTINREVVKDIFCNDAGDCRYRTDEGWFYEEKDLLSEIDAMMTAAVYHEKQAEELRNRLSRMDLQSLNI